MKRVGSAILFFAVLLGVAAPRAEAAPRFARSMVSAAQFTGEPGIEIDDRTNPPTVYVVAPEDSSQLWRSTNGGKTFRKMKRTAGAGGDSDVTVDGNGTLYVSDLADQIGGIAVSVSTNGGRSYKRKLTLGDRTLSYDRQWTASNGPGRLVMVATNDSYGTVQSWVSGNSARSFRGPYDVADFAEAVGPVTARNGIYALLYSDDAGITYAKSADGVHWKKGLVARNHFAAVFPVIAIDDAGNMYATWSEISGVFGFGTAPVYFSRSANGGKTWTRPQAISPSTSDVLGTIPSAVFPWVVAGSQGRVAISYVLARQLAGPDLGADLGGPQTSWDVVVAQTTNALRAKPSWSRAVAASSIHQGSICTVGTECLGPQRSFGIGNLPTPSDRRLLDFFGADIDRAGRMYVAYANDRSLLAGTYDDLFLPNVDVMVARQVSGTRLRP